MVKRSKRYKELQAKITGGSQYSIAEAVDLLKEQPTKFDGSIELHIKLGINAKKSDQIVRGSVQLPHGTGKTVKIMAFVNSNQEAEAKEAGADFIGTKEEIDKIKQTGKVDFEVAIATPDMMKQVGPIARILGQKGLMPNPKNETVGTDVTKMIQALKAGKVNFRNDDTGNVHLGIGKVSFETSQLIENINNAIEAIRKAKPSTAKGIYMQNTTLSSTMGPGIPISVA
ncbi:MAG: 50S ribosomal protein L1 [bacterium]|nr:50S ribosomal protein L1 [bacterium]